MRRDHRLCYTKFRVQVPDAKLKYQQLLFLGKKLPPLPAPEHTENNKVRGCVSQVKDLTPELQLQLVLVMIATLDSQGLELALQVWVVPTVKEGKVFWQADSDSMLTKASFRLDDDRSTPNHLVCTLNIQLELSEAEGLRSQGLAALLVQGLSNCTAEDIVKIQPDFIDRLGLGQALTPSRNNGFLNMFKLMQAKALDLLKNA